MNNYEDLFAALLHGKKLTHISFSKCEYVHLKNGEIVDHKGICRPICAIDIPSEWEILKEPEVYEVECEWVELNGHMIPTGNAQFSKIVQGLDGKRTKLRIEVIDGL